MTPAPAFLRFGSWVGADRDGNPFVTAQVTRETATIQADHVLRALENATTRIGRALTLHAATTPPSAGLRRALAAATPRTRSCWPRSRRARRRSRTGPTCCTRRSGSARPGSGTPTWPTRGPDEFLADLRIVQESLAAAGRGQQAHGELQHLIWQAETFGFHLAGLEVRQHSEVHARALAELRAAGPARRRARRGPGPRPRPRRCWPRSARWPGSRTGSAWPPATGTW